MINKSYYWAIELYSKEFLPRAMKHFDSLERKVLDAEGAPLHPELADENPHYKGFLLVADSDKVMKTMPEMITRPETGPRKPIDIDNKEDFIRYFKNERPSDFIYFYDSVNGNFVPVKGQLKNSYERYPEESKNKNIDQIIKDGALPKNYLDPEENIELSDIGGRTEVAIINSLKYPFLSIISANQRAYGFGMGKLSVFYDGRLESDFKFELSEDNDYREDIPEVSPGVRGVVTYYKPDENKENLIPYQVQYAYFDKDKNFKLTEKYHMLILN